MTIDIFILLFIALLIIATLFFQHKIKKDIKEIKEETDNMINEFREKTKLNYEKCSYVSFDLPNQLKNLQTMLDEFTAILLKTIDENTKNNSDFISKTIDDIRKQLSDSVEMIGDLYNFQPKLVNEINENYSDFANRTTKLLKELKEHILSKQEISRGEYLIFVKLIFDIFILKATKMTFEYIDNEIITHFSTSNTLYKSKITDISNEVLLALENIKYYQEHQSYTKLQILSLREKLTSDVFEKMNEFMTLKSIKTINEFNKNEIKTKTSDIIIEICEQKKIEVIDVIRG